MTTPALDSRLSRVSWETRTPIVLCSLDSCRSTHFQHHPRGIRNMSFKIVSFSLFTGSKLYTWPVMSVYPLTSSAQTVAV
eukprot:367542-Amphidinium_carterae.1